MRASPLLRFSRGASPLEGASQVYQPRDRPGARFITCRKGRVADASEVMRIRREEALISLPNSSQGKLARPYGERATRPSEGESHISPADCFCLWRKFVSSRATFQVAELPYSFESPAGQLGLVEEI